MSVSYTHLKASEEKAIFEEGCLSLPGIYDEIERPAKVTVRALDANGKEFELEAEGLLAVCVQHEIDHLKGSIFVDYLSPMKRKDVYKRQRTGIEIKDDSYFLQCIDASIQHFHSGNPAAELQFPGGCLVRYPVSTTLDHRRQLGP